MKKQKALNILCLVLAVLIVCALVWGALLKGSREKAAFDDGLERIDPNTIYLTGSGVEVRFSEVLLSPQHEERKLIVSTQSGIVSTQLTDNLIRQLNFDILKKTQTVTYTGQGYFAVDLDKLTADRIV